MVCDQTFDACSFNHEYHRHAGLLLIYCRTEGRAGRKYSKKRRRMTTSTTAFRPLAHRHAVAEAQAVVDLSHRNPQDLLAFVLDRALRTF